MTKGKVVLIMVDALGYRTASDRCGYLGCLVEHGEAAKYRIRGELPSVSRPMYETIHTGLPASAHGVTTNSYRGPSRSPNLFSLAKKNGLTTAAAAYNWIAELYGGAGVFDPRYDRFRMGGHGDIDNGIFYYEDWYPDNHLYADGYYLFKAFSPDYLLIHPMNCDYFGHKHGAGSFEYQHAAENTIRALTYYLPEWRASGYDVIVTADHGMDELGIHFGDTELQRETPLYIVSDKVEHGDFTDRAVTQLNVAPLACALMGIPRASGMLDPAADIRGLQT